VKWLEGVETCASQLLADVREAVAS
jgi:hypothetical protein